MTPPPLKLRQQRRALADARRWLEVDEADDKIEQARLTTFLDGPDRGRSAFEALTAARALFAGWLEEPTEHLADELEAELLHLLVPLRVLEVLAPGELEATELLHDYRHARVATRLRRLCADLAGLTPRLWGCGGFTFTEDPHDEAVAWRRAADAAAVRVEPFAALRRLDTLSLPWRAWLELEVRALHPAHRREMLGRLLRACPPTFIQPPSSHPWVQALTFARWLWSLDHPLAPLEALLPRDLPADTLRLAGRPVCAVPAPVDFVGTLEQAKARGLGLAWGHRAVSLEARERVPADLPATPGLCVARPGEEPAPGSLWKESCEVSLGVNEYRMVFLSARGERLVVDEGTWRWVLDWPKVTGTLDGAAITADGTSRLVLCVDHARHVSLRGADVARLEPAPAEP